MIIHYFRTLKDAELKILDTVRAGVWTHTVAPTEEELALLVKEYSLDENIVNDIKDFFEVPRMERSGGASYFFTRYPFDQKEEDVDTAPLLIVIGESFVLTVAQKEVPQFKPFINGSVEVHTTQKAKFFIQMMTMLTKSFEHKLVQLRRSVHRDRARLRNIGNREIVRLVNYEHELNDLVAAVIPTNGALQKIVTGNYIQLYKEDIALMEDLMIANNQMAESARSVLKTIQNVRSASEAILTNHLNAAIRVLTVITVLLTIPMVVASFYGMNVALPLESHPYAFWLVVVFVTTLVLLAVWVLKRNNWL